MQFSDTSLEQGILQKIDFLCDSDSDSYPTADKTREVNNYLERVIGKLITLNNKWDFDDSNYTDFPIAETTLVDSQSDYSLDTTHIVIREVWVKDENGDWRKLRPIEQKDFSTPLEEIYETDGLPLYYDKSGSSLVLYPAPDNGISVTLSSGLRVLFQRTGSVFTVSDTTKKPGFASPYHDILAYAAAIPFCVKYRPSRVAGYIFERDNLEKELYEFEDNKQKDEIKALGMSGIRHR
ncbi:MAG TPA: hypothetical protein ENI23_11775 [bacterium]|nr:hypothetical protein [bacterium]